MHIKPTEFAFSFIPVLTTSPRWPNPPRLSSYWVAGDQGENFSRPNTHHDLYLLYQLR